MAGAPEDRPPLPGGQSWWIAGIRTPPWWRRAWWRLSWRLWQRRGWTQIGATTGEEEPPDAPPGP